MFHRPVAAAGLLPSASPRRCALLSRRQRSTELLISFRGRRSVRGARAHYECAFGLSLSDPCCRSRAFFLPTAEVVFLVLWASAFRRRSVVGFGATKLLTVRNERDFRRNTVFVFFCIEARRYVRCEDETSLIWFVRRSFLALV